MMPSSSFGPDGSLWVAWSTDLRSTRSFLPHPLEVRIAVPAADSGAAAPEFAPYRPPAVASGPIHPREREHVRRIRSYRIQSRGREYSIYRGDLHRHTDISGYGLNDGSLLDAYRYARDAAALDSLGISDHNTGANDPYAWRLSRIRRYRDFALEIW